MLLASSAWAQDTDLSGFPAPPQAPAANVPLHFSKEPNDALPLPPPSSDSSGTTWHSSWATRPRSPEQADRTGAGASPIKQTAFQAPADQPSVASPPLPRLNPDEANDYLIPLEPPGKQRVFFTLDSEAALHERMRQEGRERTVPERVTFPDEPIVSDKPYVARVFPPQCITAEPNFTIYRRLFFEEKNSERYGWDLGPVGPVASAGKFFWDVAFFPYHLGTMPFRRFESNAGQCLPGDPVPLLLYPPQLSSPGTVLEAVAVVAIIACFP